MAADVIAAYPPGFRPRRGLNWAFIGLLYTSFYMCRYNLSIANGAISSEFGFSKAQMGTIITTALLAYACGQIINGLLADRLGGKRAMLIGAVGTVAMNVLFGVASFWGLLWLFVVIRGIDGYMQAFGAPGMVKINAAWFGHRERGRFAGIFGFMINLGRFGIFKLGPRSSPVSSFLGYGGFRHSTGAGSFMRRPASRQLLQSAWRFSSRTRRKRRAFRVLIHMRPRAAESAPRPGRF